MKIFVSHGAGGGRDYPDSVDWFIVEPRDAPDAQVKSLLGAGRTVYELPAVPFLKMLGKVEIGEPS